MVLLCFDVIISIPFFHFYIPQSGRKPTTRKAFNSFLVSIKRLLKQSTQKENIVGRGLKNSHDSFDLHSQKEDKKTLEKKRKFPYFYYLLIAEML